MFAPALRRPPWLLAPSSTRNHAELEARRAAQLVLRGEPAASLVTVPEEIGQQDQAAPSAAGQPLDERVRADFEPRFGHDFSRVRVHTDGRAAESASRLGARAYTSGRDIVFGPGRYDPASPSGRGLIAHELAHVVQQQRAGRQTVQLASELESLPEEERNKVSVFGSTLDETAQDLIGEAYTKGAPIDLPPNLTVQLGASVGKSGKKGLESVVTLLIQTSTLPSNTSITLALPEAGETYRITRVERPSQKAAGATAVPELVLVESTGPASAAPRKAPWMAFPGPFSTAQGPLPVREARQMRDCLDDGATLDACQQSVLDKDVPLAAGETEIWKTKIRRGPGWMKSDWTALTDAITALPEQPLSRLKGVKFLRAPEKACSSEALKARTCSPDTSAETSVALGTVTFFDRAFRASATRRGTATTLEATLIHEIGHLADGVFLANPLVDYMNAPSGTGDMKKVLDARSLSGMGWDSNVVDKDGGLHLNLKDPGGAPKDSFREAAIRDGLVVEDDSKTIVSGGVTKYGQSSWMELFAESYMLHFTDPDLLKAIRPNVFKYFETIYPGKAKK